MGKTSNQNNTPRFVQQATLEKLRCYKCKKYLSVLPVYKNLNGDAICGRCAAINTSSDFIRDELYEHAIEYQQFPCSNRDSGCLELLFPLQLALHEQSCPYMNHDCPTKIFNNCTWQGPVTNILEHFENKHPTFILKDCKFEVDFVNNHSENYLMPYGEELFVVTREGKSAEKTFGILVKYIGCNLDISKYIFEITLESGNKAYRYSVEQKIDSCIELQGVLVSEMLHDPITIVANICIKENEENNSQEPLKQPTDDSDEESGLNSEQLKEVECPVCMEYMVAPIYQCEVGHSICKTCKETQEVCPTCKADFKKTQNFALERIIMNMTYPCKHQGCRFKTKARNIKQHEASCLFGPFLCPLKDYEQCLNVFPLSELFNHIKDRHYECLLELDTISVPFDNSIAEDINEGYVLKHGQLLFKICFKYKFQEKQFLWSVQLVGPPEDSAKYCYELEIFDNSGRNMRLYLKMACAPLADNDKAFENLDQYVYLLYDQINKFIKNQLTYRITIMAKN